MAQKNPAFNNLAHMGRTRPSLRVQVQSAPTAKSRIKVVSSQRSRSLASHKQDLRHYGSLEKLSISRFSMTWLLRRVAACTLVFGLFAVVISHIVIDQLQFRIDALQSQSAAISSKVVRLRYNEAQLEAPQRIIASAEKMGMVSPAQVTYLTPLSFVPTFAQSLPVMPVPLSQLSISTSPKSTSIPTTSPKISVGYRAKPK